MSQLVIRAYNVKFGDALLVSVPDKYRGHESVRHILIDVGNVLAGKGGGGDDTVFEPIIDDIRSRVDKIDLYVMTHEHMDHIQGLPYANKHNIELPDIDYAWLTASSKENYYDKYPEARKRFQMYNDEWKRIDKHFQVRGIQPAAPIMALLANNSPYRTQECVAFLREVARKKTTYIHRQARLETDTHHPFKEVEFSIWGPELETTEYYGRFRPLFLGELDDVSPGTPDLSDLKAPDGVDPKAFSSLVTSLSSGIGDNLLAIDRAANNSSVVFSLEWRGWRLLFPGDAETRSWKTMNKHHQLKPVHFLKVSHHGSSNGTPTGDMLDRILPLQSPDGRSRCALISTCDGTYHGVPHLATADVLRERVDHWYDTSTVEPGALVEISFEG
jgi:beta-lactamase superfamily II metal-dependent hydrolase